QRGDKVRPLHLVVLIPRTPKLDGRDNSSRVVVPRLAGISPMQLEHHPGEAESRLPNRSTDRWGHANPTHGEFAEEWHRRQFRLESLPEKTGYSTRANCRETAARQGDRDPSLPQDAP